jgi:glycosyltransferase involved in cell wall biosynthesis
MPVCRVAHLIYSKKIGGSEMVAANVCANLDRDFFDPMILFMYKSTGAMPDVLSDLGVACSGFELTRFSSIFSPLIIASVLNRLHIDILHVHHIPLYMKSALGVRLSRVKGVVFTEHAKFSISKSVQLQKACWSAIRNVDFFSTVSDNLKQYFVNELGMPAQSIEVICNGVDTKRFCPENGKGRLAQLLAVSNSAPIIISVGRLAEAKDHESLLYVMKWLVDSGRDVHLALVGEGDMREHLEVCIRELGLAQCVTLLGNRTDVHELLPDATLFALSSRREGLPMALLEAMAASLPVVATNVGGIHEVILDGKNGFLVPPENPELLAKKIGGILDNPDVAENLGKRGRDAVESNYSMRTTAAQYSQLYKKILAQ